MLRQIQPLFFTFLSLLALTSVLPCTTAQSFQNTTSSSSSSAPSATPSKPALKIGDSSGSIYVYIGCWNESAGLPGTTGLRALDGINEAKPGVMTVERCLDFCAHGNKAHGAYQVSPRGVFSLFLIIRNGVFYLCRAHGARRIPKKEYDRK
ncbi:hypothetical protein NUW58_g7554 [Xylaria curta]|uniref:Uncharacterized protein n=1 Tax=Xylaria curta TaxID=42375 RepID=A0ACC1NFZ1_9PEZI|nr:hypothetical protein NUW58_g7554 [Xylaria curta]